MAIPALLKELTGRWQGSNSLWLRPDDPVRKSEATAVCKTVAQGKFFELHYTWADDGKPQDGVLLLSQSEDQLNAAWIDSWHMDDKIMNLTGAAAKGNVSVLGSYSAPTGPDWGWRIALQSDAGNQFRLLMYNIMPVDKEMLAVEAIFTPDGSTHKG